MNVNLALASLNSTTDDLIKSQSGFTQYVDGIGWLGSMTRMYPGEGYKLETLESGVLQYPPRVSTTGNQDIATFHLPDTPWILEDAARFQTSMTITALLESDTIGVNCPTDAICAMVGDEVRGIARPRYIPELEAYRVFLTIYGNSEESVRLEIWDADRDCIYQSNETWIFHEDLAVGTPLEPEFITRIPLGIGDQGYIPDVFSLGQNYPNPFNPQTTMGFGLPEDGHVSIRIFNLRGQEIRTLVNSDFSAGYRFVVWNGLDEAGHHLVSGVYLVVMQSGSFREVHKMLMLK